MDAAAQPTLTLTRELIARRSLTPDDAGCQALLSERLVPLGFTCTTLAFNGVTNLWARRGTARPLVCFAGHTDVVPTGPLDRWDADPFTPTVREGFLYGRGAADCKGNIVMHLAALRALKEVHGRFPTGVKVICEGSEEQGTGGLEAFVPENPELLAADAILVCDTGNFAAGVPTLTTTLRGVTTVDVKVSALASAMYSGMFGGPAPDPVAALLAMLSSCAAGVACVNIDDGFGAGTIAARIARRSAGAS